MAVDIRREILKNLYENQLIEDYNIMTFLIKECPDVSLGDIWKYLFEMETDAVIYNVDAIQKSSLYTASTTPCKSYAGRLEMRIKHPGIIEIQEYLLTEQTRSVNESLIVANRSSVTTNQSIKDLNDKTTLFYGSQKTFNIIALLIAGLTGLFIAMQYFKDDAKDLKPIYTRLEQIMRSQDSMRKAQVRIDSSLSTMAAKDSLKPSVKR
ncbi:MAG: hypothetical protein M3N30_09555 [Bacteroidota bacterium]|nr:hypothetical protein [Bacteroidota bacterium]